MKIATGRRVSSEKTRETMASSAGPGAVSPRPPYAETDYIDSSDDDEEVVIQSVWPVEEDPSTGHERTLMHRYFLVFEDHSDTPALVSQVVNLTIGLIIVASVVCFVVETLPAWRHHVGLKNLEVFFVGVFTFEYLSKFLSSPAVPVEDDAVTGEQPGALSKMFMFFLRPENRRSPAGSMLHPPCSHRGVHTCLTTVSLRLGTLPPPPSL